MLLLTTTTETIRCDIATAADVDVYVAYVDAPIPVTPTSNITPGKQILNSYTIPGNLTVCDAPGTGFVRNVKNIVVSNTHSSASTLIQMQFLDGLGALIQLAKANLLPGEALEMDESGSWTHYDAQRGAYTYTPSSRQNLGATGTLAETMPRELCPEVNTTVGASGVLFMQAVALRSGDTVTFVDLWSATTAAGTPTNQNVGLYDASRSLQASCTNKTTEAWAANSLKIFTFTSPFKVPVTGTYYIGYYMTATTVTTLKGGTARTGGQLAAAIPTLSGTSSTGLTTALPQPAAAITATTTSIYAALR